MNSTYLIPNTKFLILNTKHSITLLNTQYSIHNTLFTYSKKNPPVINCRKEIQSIGEKQKFLV